jgi:hypothetical protein
MSESSDFTAIRIGTRVRHTDGAEGKIAWANATSVKIQWDDGEKVTWKRAELASKGLTILDADEAAQEAPPAPAAEVATPETSADATATTPAATSELHLLRGDGTSVTVPYETKDDAASGTDRPTDAPIEAPVPAAKKRARHTKTAEEKPARISALDAAAKVLGEEHRPMGCQELIGAMAMKGYWTSPGGKTPAATLYSALLREMDTKGDAARFVKVGKGQFALRPQA